MKYYIYKILIFFFCLFLLFQLTVGLQIRSLKNKFENLKNKETTMQFKDKIREEIKKGIEKDRILNNEDAILLKNFFEKISDEIRNSQ